jgi:hypothetical protein
VAACASVETCIRINRGVAQPGRQHAAGAVLQRAQAGGRRDPVQPGPQRRAFLERLVATPAPQIGLLDKVFGVMHRTEHSVTVRDQLGTKRRRLLDEILLSRHGLLLSRARVGPKRYSSTETLGRRNSSSFIGRRR